MNEVAKVISIALQKGGSGKTSTATTLAAIFASRGMRTLLIDFDAQANSTAALGIVPDVSIADVLAGACQIEAAIVPLTLHLGVLPADRRLANVEAVDGLEADHLAGHLDGISDNYDYILIDTPPAIGNLLKNALYASDYVLIPTETQPFGADGIEALHETIEAVNAVTGHLSVLGIVLIKHDSVSNLSKAIESALQQKADELGTVLFSSRIRKGIAVPESQLYGESLLDYAPKSKPCKDYMTLADEILKVIEGEKKS